MFQIRTSKPGAGNKYYIKSTKGGWSGCIIGKPTDKDCNVLANCVGYACGRFSEIYSEITGYKGMKYPHLSCNAENFIERAKSFYGLEVVDYPVLGGIMVMQKGSTLKGQDGAGHVFIVEKIYDENHIYTSESGYNSKAFWNAHRYNTNGRWGHGSSYKFRGCIVNPAIGKVTGLEDKEPTKPEEPVKPTTLKFKKGDEVIINGYLYKSSNAASPAGSVKNKKTKITRTASGAKHQYNTTGDLGWMDESSITLASSPTPTPAPKPKEIEIGSEVIISGKLYKSSNAASASGSVKNKRTKITRIAKGAKHPYNTTGDLGWMDKSSITLV